MCSQTLPDHKNTSFEQKLRRGLEDLNADLPQELWTLISWLEQRGQSFVFNNSQAPFLSTSMVSSIDELWSQVNFVLPQDFMHHWIGKTGYEQQIIPFVRCGGDGSYFALWESDDAPSRFVFLGSEGEAFVVAEDVRAFMALISMGYHSVEGREMLAATPSEIWSEWYDDPWPQSDQLAAWLTEVFGITLPARGADLLPYPAKADPFTAFIEKVCGG